MTETLPSQDYFDAAFDRQPVMGVFRHLSQARAVARAERAWDAGVRNVEIPVQTADAMPTLRAVIAAAKERGLPVGAGTVTSLEQLDAVQQAGAAYTVSPGLDRMIVLASAERGLPHLPGVATASEILRARHLGLRWVKAFPASVLGPAWIRAQLGPFPDQRFVVTGGMNAEVAASFLEAGARTVAIGGDFDTPATLSSLTSLLP